MENDKMIQASSGGRIPAPRGPRILGILAAAAIAMLALSACGGGGSAGRSGGGLSGPSGGGATGQAPSNTAGGVAFEIKQGAGTAARVQFNEGEIGWSTTTNHKLAAPSTSGWMAQTFRRSSAGTHRFHAVWDVTEFADTDYIAYGHWAANFDKPTEKPEFESFYYGNQLFTGNVPAGTSNATYTGGAAGIYKKGSSGQWGYFKSDISLAADFSAGTITATLSNFGVVSLFSPSFSFSSVTTEAAKISGNSFTHADWGGRFFGPSGAAPTGAAGWFEGLTSNQSGGSDTATLYGSFGATR